MIPDTRLLEQIASQVENWIAKLGRNDQAPAWMYRRQVDVLRLIYGCPDYSDYYGVLIITV